ncbi:hypothetical protein [Williamsia phyllosphaerae]|nr:hypothetical protein [Williamsia phyllosphaerae]
MIIAFILICGGASAAIANGKNRSAAGFFLLGALFPLIGLIVALLISPGHPVPKGMRKVTCPRCGTHQNIGASDSEYECWQCKQTSETTPLANR